MLLASACAGSLFLGALPAATAHTEATKASSHAPVSQPEWLDQLRGAMERFRDPRVAERHGYKRTNACSESPFTLANGTRVGGMGYHYVNARLVEDPAISLLRPEILVYVPDGRGGRKLGAVEYLKNDDDQLISTANDRPELFGQQFQGPSEPHENGKPIHYDLHVWLFKHNPRGLFEPWNVRVTCPRQAA